MVNFCSLNIRGLNKKPKQASVRDLIRSLSVSFVGLVETRVKERKATKIVNAINRNWQWIFNYEHRENGRIWFGWTPTFGVFLLFLNHPNISIALFCPLS